MYRIAVTNRHLCEGDFLERIRQIAQGDEYNAILLREKDLSHEEYEELAKNSHNPSRYLYIMIVSIYKI